MIESTSSQFENLVSSKILFVNDLDIENANQKSLVKLKTNQENFVKLKTHFVKDLNIKNANSKTLNMYIIYLLNDYAVVNIENYDL
jgi:hypothetical protein